MSDATLGLLTYLAGALIAFVVLRQVLLWYWKVNQQVALLTEIRDTLQALTVAAAASPGPRGGTPPETPSTTGGEPVVSVPAWKPALTPWEERASKGSHRE